MTTLTAAGLWGCTQSNVCRMCARGRVPGAVRAMNGKPPGVWSWIIPDNAEKPTATVRQGPYKTRAGDRVNPASEESLRKLDAVWDQLLSGETWPVTTQEAAERVRLRGRASTRRVVQLAGKLAEAK